MCIRDSTNTIQQHIEGLEYLGITPEKELDGYDKYRMCVKQTFDELEKLLENKE